MIQDDDGYDLGYDEGWLMGHIKGWDGALTAIEQRLTLLPNVTKKQLLQVIQELKIRK